MTSFEEALSWYNSHIHFQAVLIGGIVKNHSVEFPHFNFTFACSPASAQGRVSFGAESVWKLLENGSLWVMFLWAAQKFSPCSLDGKQLVFV